MTLYDRTHYRQAEAGATASGGEERFEYLVLDVRGNTRAIVFNQYLDRVTFGSANLHDKVDIIATGLHGIGREIQQGPQQHVMATANRRLRTVVDDTHTPAALL